MGFIPLKKAENYTKKDLIGTWIIKKVTIILDDTEKDITKDFYEGCTKKKSTIQFTSKEIIAYRYSGEDCKEDKAIEKYEVKNNKILVERSPAKIEKLIKAKELVLSYSSKNGTTKMFLYPKK